MRWTRERPIQDTPEYSDACLGLVQAKRLYDPSIGAFSTLAFLSANRIIKRNRRKPVPAVSIGTYGMNTKDASTIKWLKILDPVDESEPPLTDEQVDDLIRIGNKILGHDDFQVLLRRCLGRSYREIGAEFKISRERVHQLVCRINSKLAAYQQANLVAR